MGRAQIEAVIQIYFDANFEADAAKIAGVLHEQAHVYGRDEAGTLLDMDKSAFVALIDSLSADPAVPRQDEILAIDFIGEHAAVARVRIRVGDIIYTDTLNFMYLDGKWGIISKIYAGSPV